MQRMPIRVVGEVMFARVLPGALNLLVIILVGRYLSAVEYGQFSLLLATITLFVSVVIGPIEQAIVPLHARQALAEGKGSFEGQLLGAIVFIVGVLGILTLGFVLLGLVQPAWLLLFLSSSFSRVFQPILRARLQFWSYGLAEIMKAAVALVFVVLFLRYTPDASTAVLLYAIGLFTGTVVGWILAGFPLPRLPNRAFFKNVIPVGTGLTSSTLAEALLFVGARYVIMLFGSPQFLGVFSFALDLAQRSVGVMINIASFAIIPRAYVKSAQGDDRVFRKMLVRGALTAGGMSLIVFTGIMGLEYFGIIAQYLGDGFSEFAFIAVSAAVVINRLKKLSVDPVLVSRGIIRAIPMAYIMVGPFSLLLISGALLLDSEALVLAIYAISYFLVALLTLAACRSVTRMT
ncbi:lipopolysaccharide biosynthesis protein [Halomonas alkalicola]|uniref:Oligosaccharide flippase family protein n=1 Tax=Halomonas alkalicola TaxID=1930622 RepID=A0ABY9H4M0_9GAMM|nr:oligosaccharide flippase family protein [Halomonas alkalicola]WLI73384.1 oligosaccharide flippase family protein [Halomonas alkalicola]